MATITRRTNKNGEISFLIRVYVREDSKGKQITKAKTWRPQNTALSPAKLLKAAEKEAALLGRPLFHIVILFTSREEKLLLPSACPWARYYGQEVPRVTPAPARR